MAVSPSVWSCNQTNYTNRLPFFSVPLCLRGGLPSHYKILRIRSALKQLLGLDGSPSPNRNQRKSNHVYLPRRFPRKKVRDTKPPTLPLPRKSKPQKFPLCTSVSSLFKVLIFAAY